MEKIRPTNYDLIVLGTGLEESLIAAAAATSGLSVLQLDNESYYGSQWAGLGFDEFVARLRNSHRTSTSVPPSHQDTLPTSLEASHFVEVPIDHIRSGIYSNVEISGQAGDSKLLKQFVIDLAPQLLYTAGPLVDCLLRFKAENYLAFRLIKSYFWQHAKMLAVPASRADIFKSEHLTPINKRSLMRFLKSTLEAIQGQGSLKDTFGLTSLVEILKQENLPPELQSTILYSLAMLDVTQLPAESPPRPVAAESQTGIAAPNKEDNSGICSGEEGLQRIRRFIESTSGYGGAFMAADYGTGELPQAFCRVAAVAGATYVLRAGVESLLLDAESQSCKGVKLKNGQTLTCQALAANSDFLPPSLWHLSSQPYRINRAVIMLKSSRDRTSADERPDQFLLTIPPSAISEGVPAHPVRVLQLGKRSLVAPEGRRILYLNTVSNGSSPSEELKPVADVLLPSDEDLLMAMYYTQELEVSESSMLPRNVALCQPPGLEVGYRLVIERAQKSFKKLFVDRDFLPETQSPQEDPDDIDLGA